MTPLIGRREFITLLGGAATGPLAARAQQAGRTYRVSLFAGALNLADGAGPVMGRGVPALLDELRRLGFSEGQNLTIDYHSTNQPAAQFALDLAEMVRAKPDVIITSGAVPQLQAVMPVSGLIPIVFWANNFDPIERGYVKSLSRPGGKLTLACSHVSLNSPRSRSNSLPCRPSPSAPAWASCGTGNG